MVSATAAVVLLPVSPGAANPLPGAIQIPFLIFRQCPGQRWLYRLFVVRDLRAAFIIRGIDLEAERHRIDRHRIGICQLIEARDCRLFGVFEHLKRVIPLALEFLGNSQGRQMCVIVVWIALVSGRNGTFVRIIRRTQGRFGSCLHDASRVPSNGDFVSLSTGTLLTIELTFSMAL